MHDPAVLRFALLSGLIGFAAFCISYALFVWKRRNASISDARPTRNETWRRWAFGLALTGCMTMSIGVAVREMDRVEGVLSGDGLYAVRSPGSEFRLTYLARDRTVDEGDVIARLESPEAVAKAEELELECRRLEKERDALLLDSLTLDPELVRRHQNAITIGNQLQASIDQLLPANESVLRQGTLESLARLEKKSQLEIDIAWYQGELKRATQEQVYVNRELQRMNQLIEQEAITESEVDLRRKQADALNMEIANLVQRIDGMNKHKAQIDSSLREIEALLTGQREILGSELDRARTDRAEAGSKTQELSAKLEEDLERARGFRERQVEQLDLKLAQCRIQLAGVRQTLVIRAPYTGTVVYRDPSPKSAEEQSPLFVLARHSGFRLQARLPRRQAAALENTGELAMKLVDPFVEPYFGGHYLGARPMPHKPNQVVAEFACQPPKEAIREWMSGEKTVAQLQWRPPLTTLLPFQLGVVLFLTGLVGWGLTSIRHPHPPTKQPRDSNGHDQASKVVTSQVADSANGRRRSIRLPAHAKASLESGAVSALHELLGERLREGVLRDEVDNDLLSAVEWALDRHHSRAVRQIRMGLGCDGDLEKRVHQLHQEVGATKNNNGNGSLHAVERERVLRVLRTIVPSLSGPNANPC